MATITADTFLDGGTARTAGEAWTLNGGKLTVRTDTRVHANAPASMTGSLGAQTVSATLGGGVLIDGRNVRWMPYDTGTGNVPAIGTTISQGGVSGYLLGVWDTLTSAPTAAGAAMPANGHIKLREVTSGPFAAGALTGIGASATGPDVTGWIEFVQDQTTLNVIPRKGTGYVVRGDWFYLDDTNGSDGQTLQLPTNGGGTGTPSLGVWVETSAGSGTYEFWPAITTSDGWGTATTPGISQATPDARQKFVKLGASGVMTFGAETITVQGTPSFSVPAASAATYVWKGGEVEVTLTSHGRLVGERVYLDFTTGGGTDGLYTIIRVAGSGVFTVALAGDGTGGNVSVHRSITVTTGIHGLKIGDRVTVTASTGTLTAGEYEIISIGSTTTFNIENTSNTHASGNCTVTHKSGLLPPTGCKTRVPNVFMRTCTTAARATNMVATSSNTNKVGFTTTSAGAIDMEYAYSDWYFGFAQPYSVRLYHCVAGADPNVTISECATALDIDDIGHGGINAPDQAALTVTSCFAGGTIKNSTFMRWLASGTSDHAVTLSLCRGQTIDNCRIGMTAVTYTSGYSLNVANCENITVQNCDVTGPAIYLTTSLNCTLLDNDYCAMTANRAGTVASYALILLNSFDIRVDGLTFGRGGTIEGCEPYTALMQITSCSRVRVRNIGTRAAPVKRTTGIYGHGTRPGYVFVTGANNADVRLSRIYVDGFRTGVTSDLNSDKGIVYENVSCPTLNTAMPSPAILAALNCQVRGGGISAPTVAANASVYGSHIFDLFWYDLAQPTPAGYTWAANVVNINSWTHALRVGDVIHLDFTSGGGTPDGLYAVQKINATNQLEVALTGSGTAGNVTVRKHLPGATADEKTTRGMLHVVFHEPTTETAALVGLTGTAQFTSAPGLTLPASGDKVEIETAYTVKGHTGFFNNPPRITPTFIASSNATTAYTWAANVLTVTLATHNLKVGDTVLVQGISGGLTDCRLLTIATVPTTGTFTCALTGSGTAGNLHLMKALHDFKYKIDTGSGYNASWRNLDVHRWNVATTAGSAVVTMNDTTGLEVGDYMWGEQAAQSATLLGGSGLNAKISTIDSGTQVTLNVNSNITTTNSIAHFGGLADETISASTGFKLKVQIATQTPNTQVNYQYLQILTTTTAASQDNRYPLDTNGLTLTGLVNPSEVRIYDAGTTTEIGGQETITSGTFTTELDAGTYPDVDISILCLGYQNTRLLGIDMSAGDVTIPVQQVIDRQYANPA